MKQSLSLLALIAAVPALAEDSRQLDAHVHGVGVLNIAIDGTVVAMEFHAPGADIVGFEYEATSDADVAIVEAAIATLGVPLDLFVLPDAAGCAVTQVEVELEIEGEEDDHDDHDDHDEHDEEDHDDHEEHDEEDHDDHDEHDHDEHAEAAGHTEFHAEYTLTCDSPDALTEIAFAYFDLFPNAVEVDVQMITSAGAQAFEVEREAPLLSLGR